MFSFRKTPERAFRKWFAAHEAMLFDFERDRDAAFGALAAALARVGPDLPFEFGPKEDGRRELVISAGGLKSAFPVVQKLVAAAPVLARWRFTAFRPRRAEVMALELGAVRAMKVGTIRFVPFEAAPQADRFPLTELAARFDARHAARLH